MTQDRREALLKKIDTTWSELLGSIEGLTDEQMLEPGVVGDWSVKDILAHITTWEAEALQHLPSMARDEQQQRYSTRYGGLDAFNALKFQENRDRPLSEVRSSLGDAHQRVLDYLATVPEELLHSKERFRTRLRWDTYSHYPIHAEHIRAWRVRHGIE